MGLWRASSGDRRMLDFVLGLWLKLDLDLDLDLDSLLDLSDKLNGLT